MNEMAADVGAPSETAQLYTRQLVLRPMRDADAPLIAHYFTDWDVVKQTVAVPYPYDERSALTWIARVRRRHEQGTQYVFALDRRSDGRMVGSVALQLATTGRESSGEIGYWLGKPHWGLGYASEAVRAMTDFAKGVVGLERIEAAVFRENRASARVLEKAGFAIHRTEVRRYPDRGGRRHVICYALNPA